MGQKYELVRHVVEKVVLQSTHLAGDRLPSST